MSAVQKDKVSVIIPVYKAEKYLAQCMDSVLGQSYENLEIILVDDGSPDRCPEMCEAYAVKDSRVRVIHQQNGGAAAARNRGLEAATGQFIAFVDSDDYIAPDMYEKLLAALVDSGADISLCDVKYVDGQGHELQQIPPMVPETIGPKTFYERMEFVPDAWRYIVPWNRLHRRALFDTVRFREGRICEDEILATEQIRLCRSVCMIGEVLYWDVRRENSVMTSPVSVKHLAAVEAFVERYDFYRDQQWNDLARAVLRKGYVRLWDVLTHVDVSLYQKEVEPWVKKVAARQLRRADPRGAWLWLCYRRRLRAGAGEKHA